MSRFNLRNKPRISYYELDEPNLDEYVFCSHCGDFVYEFCSIHGPLLVIPDDKPPAISPFPPCVPRAALTIPHVFLHIAPSKIPGAGLGVFTTLALPSGVRFGPYEGKKTEEITSMYCWQINDYNNKRSYVIDAEDPNHSNWMRYVNCSRHWYEQNLIAYQYRGRLYYRTIKIIPRYTELMVFYGSEFAHRLQINLKNYNAPTSYAQKFGSSISKHLLSDENKNEISLTMKSMKEPSRLKRNYDSNLKLANTQKNKEIKASKDVPDTHFEKNMQPAKKKVKFNARKETQSKEISNNCGKNKTFVSKNKTVAIKLQSKEKNYTIKSYDLNNNQNMTSECLKKLQKTSKNNEDIAAKVNKASVNLKIKKSKQMDDSIQSKTSIQYNFSFDICNFKSPQKKALRSNLVAHGVKNKYTCTYCDYITKFKQHLIYHIRTHTGERPYACNFCEKKFNQKSNLTVHIRTHTGERPYACNICEKKFNDKSSLTVHIRTHTGERPYACNICEKKFNDKHSLSVHIRTHTGEKPYACNFCEKKFNQKIQLDCHIRSHTGETPYACNFCEKKFYNKSNLTVHIRTHTGERPYACNICEKKFKHKFSLDHHIKIHNSQ